MRSSRCSRPASEKDLASGSPTSSLSGSRRAAGRVPALVLFHSVPSYRSRSRRRDRCGDRRRRGARSVRAPLSARGTRRPRSRRGCDAIDADGLVPSAATTRLPRRRAAGFVGARARPPRACGGRVRHRTERYAVDAFAVEAFDYLLKPVDPERLARVLDRLRAATPAGDAAVAKIPVVAPGGSELVDFDQL